MEIRILDKCLCSAAKALLNLEYSFPSMTLVIIDTNILLVPGTLGVDIFSEIEKACDFKPELVILEASVEELKKIMKEQGGKFKSASKLALALLKDKEIPLILGKGHVDDLLVEHSKQGAVVVTQDAELKKRLTKPYLTLRQKKYFVMIR